MSPRVPVLLQRPHQGWSSLLLLLLLLLLVGASIAGAREAALRLSEGAASTASSLPVLMLASGLIGYFLARSHLGVVRAHIIGAAVAAALLLFVAGGVLLDAGAVVVPDDALSERVGAVWLRLEEDLRRYAAGEVNTPPVVAYLVLGAFCWTTAQFSAFSIFRYDRGGPAVMAMGTMLFLNLALGPIGPRVELLPVLATLACFSTLAMLLLMRLQLMAQRTQWARRHIADTGEVSRLFLRSGVLFVLLTVISATSLAAVATVDAQEVKLGALEEPIEDFGDEIARVLGLVGIEPAEEGPPTRGEYSPVLSKWSPVEGTAFTALVEPGRLRDNYWWGYARDWYEPARGWRSTDESRDELGAGEAIRVPAGMGSGGPHRAEVEVTIEELAAGTLQAFGLADAASYLERDVAVLRDAGADSVSAIEYQEAPEIGDRVNLTVRVRDYTPGATSLTASQLRAAGTAYPDWTEPYLSRRGDGAIVGPNVDRFVAEIRAEASDAYDQALAVQGRLGSMAYEIDMTGVCDGYDGSVPECVLAEEQGFCQHYATTMTVVLRELGIPSRFITGYLPGTRDPASGRWTVEQSSLHNWVEAYFPGIGWVRFDPTPGRAGEGQSPTALPEGAAGPASPEPTPSGTGAPPTFEPTPGPTPGSGAVGPVVEDGGDQTVTYVIGVGTIVALLLTVVSLVLLFRLRRLPGGDEGLAYRGIVSLATRLGYGPYPSQTEYEFADSLSEAIPTVRDELYVVAEARVETAYGQRHLDAQRRGRLRAAYARVRTALLRLSLRRR